MFEYSFTHLLSSLLTGGVLLIGIIYTLRADVKGLKGDMGIVKIEMQKITSILVSIGKQDERLNALDKRLDILDRRFDTLNLIGKS